MAIALLVATLGAFVVTLMGWLGFVGKLRPNGFAGIRTSFTRSNDDNWYGVHRAGGPYIILTGAAALAAGLSLLPFAIAGKLPDAFVLTVVGVQALLVLSGALVGAAIGTARTKAASGV